MSPPLRVLHLEDNPNYSALVKSKLEAEGFSPEMVCVETREDFLAALEKGGYDLIIADYFLPTYDGLKALKLAQEKQPETPILLVSGTIGEEAAIQSLRAGATDYVLKHWPERLMPAVHRALRESEERKNRLKAESELTRREKHFRAMTENSLDAVSVLDREGNFLYNTPSVENLLGYRTDELMGRNAFSFIHDEDLKSAREAFMQNIASPKTIIRMNFRVRHRDGGWRHLETICKSFLDDPEIAGVVVNSRDVSEQHRVLHYNAVISRLGLRLSSALSARDAAHVIVDSAAELFGWDACSLDLYSPGEDKIHPILGMDIVEGRKVEIPAAEIEDTPSPRLRRVLSNGAELILREEPLVITPDSVPFGDKARPSASLMFVPIRNGAQAIGILSIQSYKLHAYDQQALDGLQTLADYCGGALERIRVGQALRESEKRFRQLFEDSPDAVFVENIEGVVLDANAAAARLQGMRREELIGKTLTQLVPPSEAAETIARYKKLVTGELLQVEGTTLTAQGVKVPVEVRTSRIDFSGEPAMLLHVRDISERKRAEEALVSSEIRFHSVWENSVDAMRLTDENGIIVAVNAAYCKLAEMSRADLEGQPFTIVFAESEHPADLLALYKKRFAERTMTRHIQRKIAYRSGKTVEIEGTNSFVESRGQPTLLLGLYRDISERKRLEEQLRQSQKMDAIGQLAGGVAHDFNNILTVIQGHASLLKSVVPNNNSAEQISQAAERAAGLTRQLLTFSRRQMMQPLALDLNSVVSNLTKMLSRILGEDIALQFNYSPNLPVVHADAGMIEQILLNLAVNSRDAMPHGGQLSIRVSILNLNDEMLATHPEGRPGEFVRLSVSDTGTGIDAATLPHIFEPFFTTKEVGKGTGLGLATVYGIIKQHLGWAEVESQVGKGTTFHVFLPCVREVVASSEKSAVSAPGPRGGSETILVVEDELPVRDLVCKVLKGAGYQVLEAATGVEALKVWETHKEKINLLLTDIVMPDGMSGRDLAEKVQADKPALKAIFTSGYSADMIGKDFVIQEGVNFLQKPYMPQKLIALIRNCLDGKC